MKALDAMPALRYIEFDAGETALPVALNYWRFDVRAMPYAGFQHRVWADGCCSLVLVLAGDRVVDVRVAGPRIAPLDVPVFEGARYLGIRFRPETGSAWLGVPASTLRDANLQVERELPWPVSALPPQSSSERPFEMPPEMRTLSLPASLAALIAPIEQMAPAMGGWHDESLLRDHFDWWLTTRPPVVIDALVRDAVAIIASTSGAMPIARVADLLGTTMRSLQRRFRAATSLSPKEFAAVRRSRDVLRRVVAGEVDAPMGGWSTVANAAGFADQSHLVRELVRLTHFTPRALEARLQAIDHAALID